MALTRKSLELKCCSRWEKNYHVTSKDSRTLCIRTFLFDNKYLSGNYFYKILIRYILTISHPYTKKSRYIIWTTVSRSKTRPPRVFFYFWPTSGNQSLQDIFKIRRNDSKIGIWAQFFIFFDRKAFCYLAKANSLSANQSENLLENDLLNLALSRFKKSFAKIPDFSKISTKINPHAVGIWNF